ncbi:MAG: ATP-binding protein [Planctomycetaceae bacterium]|jgi:predicted ATPase|nr:ATP-binding protein [Planctomycetaceae bacterium]
MGKIEGIWVRNYGVLRQVGIGSCFLQFAYVNDDTIFTPFQLSSTTVITGTNGSGKSTFLDVFAFLADTYRYGLDKALFKRGGYDIVHTLGSEGPISIGINYRQDNEQLPVTYTISIGRDIHGRAFIETEMLAYREGTTPFPVLYLQNGKNTIRYIVPDEGIDDAALNRIEFTDYLHLGIAQLPEHPAYPALKSIRQLIEGIHQNNFSTDIARGLSASATTKFANPRGYSLFTLIKYMEQYGDNFAVLLDRIVPIFPQISGVRVQKDTDGNPMLFFRISENWLPATRVSDGILRLFNYVLLLEETFPAPLICIEEAENGLDLVACWRLLDAITKYNNRDKTSQLFITTHHNGFVDAVKPETVWVFEQNDTGNTSANRACDDLIIQNILEQGQTLPQDWFSRYFETKM